MDERPPAGGFGGAPFAPMPVPPPHESEGASESAASLIAKVVIGAVLVGMVAVLGVFIVKKKIGAGKTVEARNSIGQIAKNAAESYVRDDHRLCPSASRPVPVDPLAVRGRAYTAPHEEWSVDLGSNAGFACVRFEGPRRQHYQYDYKATATSFTATARGDLNGDLRLSLFEYGGQVNGGAVVLDGAIHAEDETE